MATRIRQKLRTRRALLEAAQEMIREGRTPTVAEVAERALVSRATAYRYFPTQDALLDEAPLDLDWPTEESLFGHQRRPVSATEGVSLVRQVMYEFSTRNEHQYRLFLRNWLDRWLRQADGEAMETRGARRQLLLERALQPVRDHLDEDTFERLKIALAVMVGLESTIVLHDVLGLDRDRAEEVMDWAVRTLVSAVTK